MDKLKIGLIGVGDVARAAHLPSFAGNQKVEVVAVADPDTESAGSAAKSFEIGKVVEDYREILDDPSVDAVDICAPHHLHYQMAMDALNAGKHVICEKPIAVNLEEADKMIGAAHELGLWLLVTLNQRFLPINRKVRELINDGTIGRPFLVNALITGDVLLLMNDPYHWKGTWDRAGGGAFFDTGTHLVDLMHYWFGEPTAVTATLKKLIVGPENKADDNAVATLEWGDDLIANLIVSYTVDNEPWSEKKFIYGSAANISMISEAVVPMFIVEDGSPRWVEVEHNADWWSWSQDRGLRHFVDCILEGAEPVATAEDARSALKTVLAAYESAKEGRRVVIGD